MRRSALVFLATASLAFVACGGGTGTRATRTTSPPASSTESTTPEASPSPSEMPSPSSTAAAPTPCDPEERTSLSSLWQTHTAASGAYAFSYPEDWEDLTGQVTYEADQIVVEATLAEAGLTGNEMVAASLVRDTEGTANVTALEFEAVQSPTDLVYQRQEDRTATLPGVDQVLGTRISACVGGQSALGMDFLFTAPAEDTGELTSFYQRSFFFVREGTLHVVQLLTIDQAESATLEEILRTWEWSSADGTAFAEAATTAEIDPALEAPDPATFTSTFAPDAAAIYVVFRLQEGIGGEVQIAWERGEEPLVEDSLTLPDDGSWAYHAITPPTGGFSLGSYEVTLTLAGTGESLSLSFSVAQP